MRLTLRTLLAYLDDTLDPTQTRLIGQKIAESEVAQQLIARIRELSRQRRPSVPPATGPEAKLDVNTIAEYLDNVLPPEQVVQVEDICLESDEYLGEVGSCHQILTFLEGEPMPVSPPARQRMYGLIKGGAASARKGKAAKTPTGGNVADDHDEADETLMLGLPNFLRQASWGRWLAPLACIAVLVAALAVTVWLALPHDSPPTVKGTEVAHRDDPAADKAVETPPEKQPETPSEKTPQKNPEQVPDKQPETPAEKTPEKQPEKQPIGKVPADRPNNERRALGKFSVPVRGYPSLLVQRPADKNTWQRVAPEGKVFSGDALVSLPGFRSEVQLDSGLGMNLLGALPEFGSDQAFREGRELPVLESAVILHIPEVPFTVDFTLDHGRVLLLSKHNGETPIKVRFQREIWEVTLLDDQTQVSLDLWGRYPRNVPFSKEPGGEEPMAVLIFSVLKGSARLKVGYQTFAVRPSTQYVWDNIGPMERAPQVLTKLPDWYTTKLLPPRTQQIQDAITALEELKVRLGQKNTNVDVALMEMRKDPKLANRILGVLCLGAIDDISHLFDILNDARTEMRGAAIETLRHWIGRQGDHDLKLYKLLHDRKDYSWPQAEIVMLLLHSFSEEDTAKPETYETLIDYLRHDKLPIRELAYWHLVRMVPDGAKIPYDPAAPGPQRENACKMWEKLIPSGKLPPKPGNRE